MKAKVFSFLLIVIVILFSACNTSGDMQNPYKNASQVSDKNPVTQNNGETANNANITRDQAIQKIREVSNSAGDLDIHAYPEMDKVVDDVRYYFIQVVFTNRMSAAYYVDNKEGNVFIAVGGELDIDNPLLEPVKAQPIPSDEESGEAGGVTKIVGPETAVIKDLFESIGMTPEQVEHKFGRNYKKMSVDYNGCMEAFLYSDRGFTVAFDNGKVKCIYCTDKIEINGARSGMDFSQIQEILGKTSIRQTWVDTPINAAYEIEYRFNGRTVVFFSRENKGNNSIMSIR